MYTEKQQQQMIHKMKLASTTFYCDAVQIGNHAFIEFTGLMNEYIKMCDQTMKAGIDFNECSQHTRRKLVTKDYNLTYIREKLDCIFLGEINETVNRNRPNNRKR